MMLARRKVLGEYRLVCAGPVELYGKKAWRVAYVAVSSHVAASSEGDNARFFFLLAALYEISSRITNLQRGLHGNHRYRRHTS